MYFLKFYIKKNFNVLFFMFSFTFWSIRFNLYIYLFILFLFTVFFTIYYSSYFILIIVGSRIYFGLNWRSQEQTKPWVRSASRQAYLMALTRNLAWMTGWVVCKPKPNKLVIGMKRRHRKNRQHLSFRSPIRMRTKIN